MFMKLYHWLLPHSRVPGDTAKGPQWADGWGGRGQEGGMRNTKDNGRECIVHLRSCTCILHVQMRVKKWLDVNVNVSIFFVFSEDPIFRKVRSRREKQKHCLFCFIFSGGGKHYLEGKRLIRHVSTKKVTVSSFGHCWAMSSRLFKEMRFTLQHWPVSVTSSHLLLSPHLQVKDVGGPAKQTT